MIDQGHNEVQRMMAALADEIYQQSKMHSDAVDAPDVWHSQDHRFLCIDGCINIERLARAALR
jgi:hypothetical protein